MTLWKGQVLHLSVLGVAAALALGVWTRDDDAKVSTQSTQVEVWGGDPDAVSALSFESSTRKLRLEPKKDALGRWYVGTVDKDEPAPAVSPHGSAGGGPSNEPPAPAKHTTTRFVGVKAADDFLKSLAPLHALRAVGKIEGSRAEEFGFDKPEGTLKITISGKPQSLLIGGSTPGGTERYAKSHDLSRVPGKNEGWADSAPPTELDETAGNWMSKLGRLHVQDWVEKPSAAPGPDKLVVRVDYFAGSKPLGSLELYKLSGEKGNEYLAKTEYGRWFARVITSAAEQVDQDSSSLVK